MRGSFVPCNEREHPDRHRSLWEQIQDSVKEAALNSVLPCSLRPRPRHSEVPKHQGLKAKPGEVSPGLTERWRNWEEGGENFLHPRIAEGSASGRCLKRYHTENLAFRRVSTLSFPSQSRNCHLRSLPDFIHYMNLVLLSPRVCLRHCGFIPRVVPHRSSSGQLQPPEAGASVRSTGGLQPQPPSKSPL